MYVTSAEYGYFSTQSHPTLYYTYTFCLQINAKFQCISDMMAGKPYEQHVVSRYYAIENSSTNTDDEVST